MKNDGGPAFPAGHVRKGRARPHDHGSDWVTTDITEPRHPGLTVRDWFAGMAMQGLLAQSIGTAMGSDVKHCAKYAYEMADAMLAAKEES